MSDFGFVYCLANPCMPGVLKIGMTHRSPMQRCHELSNSTSATMPFTLLCYGEIQLPREAESCLHEALSEERINGSREFFKTSFETVATLIQENTEHFCMTEAGNKALFDDIGHTFNPREPFLRLVASAGRSV